MIADRRLKKAIKNVEFMKLITTTYSKKIFALFMNLCISALICGYNALAASEYPQWWIDKGVVDVNAAVTNDYAALNSGQLKWLVTKAAEHLDEHGGTGEDISTYMAGFSITNNYYAVNQGQLKHAASLFYNRMAQLSGRPLAYPWPAYSLDCNNYAMANIGQAKNLFNFQWSESYWDDFIGRREIWGGPFLDMAVNTTNDITSQELIAPITDRPWTYGTNMPIMMIEGASLGYRWDDSAWNRHYLSSSPDAATGWNGQGMCLVIYDFNGQEHIYPLTAGSGPIDITDMIREAGGFLRIELRYNGDDSISLDKPVYVLNWNPRVNISFPDFVSAGGSYYMPHTWPFGTFAAVWLNLSSAPPMEGEYSCSFIAIVSGTEPKCPVQVDEGSQGIMNFQGNSPAPAELVTVESLGCSDYSDSVIFEVWKVDPNGGNVERVGFRKFATYGLVADEMEDISVKLMPSDAGDLTGPLVVYVYQHEDEAALMEETGSGGDSFELPCLPVTVSWDPGRNVTWYLGWGDYGEGDSRSMIVSCVEPDPDRQPENSGTFTLISDVTQISVANVGYGFPSGGEIAFFWNDPEGQVVRLNGYGSGEGIPYSEQMNLTVTLEGGSILREPVQINNQALYNNSEYGIEEYGVMMVGADIILDSFVDVDMDSYNYRGFLEPEQKNYDDWMEGEWPGKVLAVNADDADGNDVPDYAEFGGAAGKQFVPLVISLPDDIDVSDAQLGIGAEDQSNPGGVEYSGEGWIIPSGGYRIWKKDAGAARNPAAMQENTDGDWVNNGVYGDLSRFTWSANRLTLYVEGVHAGSYVMQVTLSPTNMTAPWSDAVAFTVVEVGKLQYKYGQMTEYQDMPGDVLPVPADTAISFKAVPNPDFGQWPAMKPVWGGLAQGQTDLGQGITVSISETGTNYITAECGNTVTGVVCILKVDTIDATSPAAGTSGNPPPFEGHKPWPFDSSKTPPDKHIVVFYNDVIDSEFNVQDFDVTLTANILPSSITADMLNEVWSKLSGPASGSLNRTDTFEVKYQNLKLGGVYRFDFDLGLSGCSKSEANVVLPLSGAEVNSIVGADLARADAFAAIANSKYPTKAEKILRMPFWFWIGGNGDYLGRPNNSSSRTCVHYNQMNPSTGMGAACTWFGTSVLVAKLSNFMYAYAARKLGFTLEEIEDGGAIGTDDDDATLRCYYLGWVIANGATYSLQIPPNMSFIWETSDSEEHKIVWPNPGSHNYDWFLSPGFLDLSADDI